MDYAGFAWPKKEYYGMNGIADRSDYVFSGILLKSNQGTVTGDGTTAAEAAETKFGYADCHTSNLSGGVITEVNPYTENPSGANGFDLAWAVDSDGKPVNVADKEFHYIKIATASNIKAGSFNEKSTEVSCVARTVAQAEVVGKTAAPTGVTISDGAEKKIVKFTENTQIYSVNLDTMKYVSISVNGADSADNIYVNNQRITSETAASGFKVTKEKGETSVRIIVQNGEKEPRIYLLKLTSNAEDSDNLIEGIKITAGGAVREAVTTDGVTYTESVGHRISEISVNPVIEQGTSFTVNGSAPEAKYQLAYGDNRFEISASDENGKRETVTLTVNRDNAPSSSGNNIAVIFTLYGDTKHGTSESHTYKSDRSSLQTWIAQRVYSVPSGSTLLDVFEAALNSAGLLWTNAGGNYISEINGLAEFDNGALSGWMYSINGSYSGLSGVAEQTVKNGDRIIFHYTDDYTKEQDSENWTSGSNGGTASASKPTVSLLPENTNKGENTQLSFTDVDKNVWYAEAVSYAVQNGMFSGVSETEFAPEEGFTRAMLAAVLYRMENSAYTTYTEKFSDVAEGEWYTDAVLWAAENGIMSGVSETEFEPSRNITREEFAAVLYRYAEYKGCDISAQAELGDFEDESQISEWAVNALKWAYGAKLISGMSDAVLAPKDTATRAQAAAILMRFCENILK